MYKKIEPINDAFRYYPSVEIRIMPNARGGGKTSELARQLRFKDDPHDMELLEEIPTDSN